MIRDSVEVKERDKDGDGDGIEFKVKYIGHMEWRAERYWCRGEVKDEGNIEKFLTRDILKISNMSTKLLRKYVLAACPLIEEDIMDYMPEKNCNLIVWMENGQQPLLGATFILRHQLQSIGIINCDFSIIGRYIFECYRVPVVH